MSNHTKPFIILVAEDDADDRLLAQDALQECQFPGEVRFVENGEELLDYLFQRGSYQHPELAPRPGLILLDVNMPRKDGLEALQEIKSNPALRKIPVVIFTTSRGDTDISRIYDMGANSFITKPVTFEQLVKFMTVLSQYWFEFAVVPGKS